MLTPLRFLAGVCILALTAACQTNPETVSVVAQPKTPVVKNITSFTNSLKCMDELFLAYGKRGFKITSDGIPDKTGKVAAGTKDIMISTISKMTHRSEAFRFIDIEEKGNSVFFLQTQILNQNPTTPDYYIRGAVTQYDNNVTDDGQDFSFGLSPFLSLGYSQDQIVSLVSLDLNMGRVATWEILPGHHTTNSIAIVTKSSKTSAAAVVKSADVAFGVYGGQAEGAGQSLRTLVELSLIEILGKFTRVPYWRCLELESTDPRFQSVARGWFDAQSPEEQIITAKTAMIQIGAFDGQEDGSISEEFRHAVNRYKASNDLIANGRIDFDLYYSLLTSDRHGRKALARQQQKTATTSEAQVLPVNAKNDIGLSIRPSFDDYQRLSTGDKIHFELSVKRPAYVYCYYEYMHDEERWLERVFPNRFQTNNFIQPNQNVSLPPRNEPFSIILSQAGVEEAIGCIASTERYKANLTPAILDQQDLQPIRDPVSIGLSNALWMHQKADSINSDVATVIFKVRGPKS